MGENVAEIVLVTDEDAVFVIVQENVDSTLGETDIVGLCVSVMVPDIVVVGLAVGDAESECVQECVVDSVGDGDLVAL